MLVLDRGTSETLELLGEPSRPAVGPAKRRLRVATTAAQMVRLNRRGVLVRCVLTAVAVREISTLDLGGLLVRFDSSVCYHTVVDS